MASAKIIRIQTLSDKRYPLQEVEFEKEGQPQKKEVYKRPHCAAALLIDKERKVVLLTKQFRLPVFLNNDDELTEVCAGLLEKNELPETCIIREIEEETGYRVNQIEEVAGAYLSPGSSTEKAYLFIGYYSEDMKVNEGGGKKDEGENISLSEISFSELRTLLRDKNLHDAKTILLVQHAILNNLI